MRESKKFPPGKFPPELMEKFLSSLPRDPRVLVGPKVGEDAAVVRVGRKLLAFKTDPITFTGKAIGWYGVNINANDIACVGAKPEWFLCTLLLPQKNSLKLAEEIFSELREACSSLGIYLIGGHTEVTPGIEHPILVGQMVGEVEGEPITSSGAKPGDKIILTKGVAIEGTYLIWRERQKEVESFLPPSSQERIKNFLKFPGISVVKEALLAKKKVKIHALHDPTEGGLWAGLWEVAYASRVGIRIWEEKVPVFEETERICRFYRLDPLGLLASGALLVFLPSQEAEKLLSLYRREKISASLIGEVLSPEEGVKVIRRGEEKPFTFLRDELSKII